MEDKEKDKIIEIENNEEKIKVLKECIEDNNLRVFLDDTIDLKKVVEEINGKE